MIFPRRIPMVRLEMEGRMDRRIAAPDEGAWGWHQPVPLMPMESAMSFLGRLALAKAAPSTIDFCADQGMRYDDLRLGRPEAVARLAAWGGIEPERLLHQTCRRVVSATLRAYAARLDCWLNRQGIRSSIALFGWPSRIARNVAAM